MSQRPRWSTPNDEALLKLFSDKKIDPEKIERADIENVRATYFPQFVYKNFAPLYRKKARAYCLDQVLRGKRKHSECE
jgi:hypothetical protein